MTEKETKEALVISFSAYATHKDYSVDDWLNIQDTKRNDSAFKRRYENLRLRK